MRVRFLYPLILALPVISGCAPTAIEHTAARQPTESSWQEQIAAVRAGASDVLRVDHTTVTDDDLKALDGLEDKLRRINLSRTAVSDAGMAQIGKMRDLIQLRIASDKITDAGIAHLANLQHLRYLHLLEAPITDAGLDALNELSSLESLYLDHTNVTDEGLARLLKARPGVHLHIDDHHHPLDKLGEDHKHEHAR